VHVSICQPVVHAYAPDDSWEQRQRLFVLLCLDSPKGILEPFCSEASIPAHSHDP
jgi:hypothetical protein